MNSGYSLFVDQNVTGINGLSPTSDERISSKPWDFARSPIGKSSIPQEPKSGTPPHILGLFSPSKHTETLLSSLVLPPSDNSPPSTEFSDEEDFFLPSSQSTDHDDFLQSMGGMDDLEPHSYQNEQSHSNFQGTNSPKQSFVSPWLPRSSQPFPVPSTTPINEFQSFEAQSKLAKSPNASAEHPHGEHPSRTLFVRNINSNVEEHEIRELFEAYGPTRSIYTQCKHRGFVMVSFYDIRHAKNAIRHLQGRVLRRRKLDIHYSIPRNNPSEKDQNQGTLVIFNLDPSTTHEELLSIFGAYGEIKEIRETPNKKHHKFIEFYDVREAELALKNLNRTEIKGKKIKIEPSRPGGRKNVTAASNPLRTGGNEDFHNMSSSVPNTGYVPYSTNVSSSYDGSYGTEFLPFDSMSNSFSPPAHYSMFAPGSPAQGSFMNSFQPIAQNQRQLRSTSLPVEDNAKRNRSRSAVHSFATPPRQESPTKEQEQFVLDVSKLLTGHETRTTLMIRNIPNKYTQKMILAAVDEVSRGLYDFFYLPIDFKNKCNVGYAFINFIHPQSVVEFYQHFHHQKWGKFNSEKVCKISFARIQGKEALVQRFQNSSLMTEDKKCRPIIFYSNGPRLGQQEPFPVAASLPRSEDYQFQATPLQGFLQVPDERKASRLRSLSCNQAQ